MLQKKLSSSALVLALLTVFPLTAAPRDKEVRKTLPLAKDGRVSIETYKGSIDVDTWDRAEVEVVARVAPDGTDSDQAEKVERTEVRISGRADSVTIESDYSKAKGLGLSFGWFSGDGTLPFVHYTIRVPRNCKLTIEDYKSDIRVSDLAAPLDLNTYKGKVAIERYSGRANVESYKGEISLAYSSFENEAELSTYKGRFEVSMPRKSSFRLDADSGRRGHVESDFSTTDRNGPRLSFSTYKGELKVRAM